MLCCFITCVLSELHHGLHGLRVGQSHEPEELGSSTAFMEIHLYGLLFLLEHLNAAIRTKLNTTHFKSFRKAAMKSAIPKTAFIILEGLHIGTSGRILMEALTCLW